MRQSAAERERQTLDAARLAVESAARATALAGDAVKAAAEAIDIARSTHRQASACGFQVEHTIDDDDSRKLRG